LKFAPPLRFDPQRVYFMGRSQGALTAPAFLAHEPSVRAAMLSGAGGSLLLSLLHKTEPFDIPMLLRVAVGEPIDEFHPVLNLVQQMTEPADPLNYAARIMGRAADAPPKHLFVSQGVIDHYTPGPTTDALITALQIPVASPVLSPINGLSLRGLTPVALPLSGNLLVGQQAVTAGVVQYHAVPNGEPCSDTLACADSAYCEAGQCLIDGHFAMFRDPRGEQHLASFFGTLVRDGIPTLGP
jgi:hypothetical protein